MNEKYNGWTNYETWVMGMFIDGNYTGPGDYEYYQEMAQENFDPDDENKGAYELSKALENSIEELAEELTENSGIFADLLTHAMGRVNWYELAESLLSEIEVEEDVEEDEEE